MYGSSSKKETGKACCQICAPYAQTVQQSETRKFASTALLRVSLWMLQR